MMGFTFKDGVLACIPTLLGYIGIGIAAGVVGKAANLSILEVTLLAMIVYAGAAQFIIAGLMLVATPISAIILTVFLVNSRHLLMSMAIAPSFKQYSFFSNIGIGSLLTDETFAVAMNAISLKQPITASWMHGLNVAGYIFWVLSCFVGALIGKWLPNPSEFGLDFSLVAMFIGLLYLQLTNQKGNHYKSRLLAIGIVAVLFFIFLRFMSPEIAILTSTLLGCLGGVISESKR